MKVVGFKRVALVNGITTSRVARTLLNLSCALFVGAALTEIALAEEAVTILRCESNAKTTRDYSYEQDHWVGKNDKPSADFFKSDLLRDKVFADLDTDTPTIKSLTPKSPITDEQAAEFQGRVIHRAGPMLVVQWTNPFGNKVWVASLNVEKKVAVVSETYDGATSFGVNTETLNCK